MLSRVATRRVCISCVHFMHFVMHEQVTSILHGSPDRHLGPRQHKRRVPKHAWTQAVYWAMASSAGAAALSAGAASVGAAASAAASAAAGAASASMGVASPSAAGAGAASAGAGVSFFGAKKGAGLVMIGLHTRSTTPACAPHSPALLTTTYLGHVRSRPGRHCSVCGAMCVGVSDSTASRR